MNQTTTENKQIIYDRNRMLPPKPEIFTILSLKKFANLIFITKKFFCIIGFITNIVVKSSKNSSSLKDREK